MTTSLSGKIALACTVVLTLFCPSGVSGGEVQLAWNPSPDPQVVGYDLCYGLGSGDYTSNVVEGGSFSATVTGLTPGQTYYFTVVAYDTNGNDSLFSNEVTNRVPIPAAIVAQPLTQAAVAGSAVTLAVSAVGDPPLSYQWLDGGAAIPDATNSILSWAAVSDANAGDYTVIVCNSSDCATSIVATLTVIDPPTILTQPLSETVIATTAASFSSAVTGGAPLAMQWYCGRTAIAGATNSTLAWTGVAASNAGPYHLTVTNAAGAVTSATAILTVLPTNTIATAAGSYNGLFFQTNADGTPAVTEATAGFLGNCVVAGKGVFSAKVYVGGQSYSSAGVFDICGNASVTIPRTGAGLPDLTAVLHLDLINGTRQITGVVSSTSAGDVWASPLVADLATNALPKLTRVTLATSPGLSEGSPTNAGAASGPVVGGVLHLGGVMGDTSAVSQTAPVSKDGNVPLYVSLYKNSGLVEGWIHLAGGVATGNLTWIRPAGVLTPAGFPGGFDTVVEVTGETTMGFGFSP